MVDVDALVIVVVEVTVVDCVVGYVVRAVVGSSVDGSLFIKIKLRAATAPQSSNKISTVKSIARTFWSVLQSLHNDLTYILFFMLQFSY